jgi:hypothetical protein
MKPDAICIKNKIGRLDDTEIIEVLKSFRVMLDAGGILEIEEKTSDDGIFRSCSEFENIFNMAFFEVKEKAEFMERCIWRLV